MPVKKGGYVSKLPWESPFGGMSIHEEDVDPEQVGFSAGTYVSFDPDIRLCAVYVHRGEFEWVFASPFPTAHMTDLQQVFHQDSWEHRKQESAMARLEDAAQAGDERAFLDALKEVEWRNRASGDFTRAMQLAFKVGAHLAARQLSVEGAKHHPDDPEIQKYARVLAPPKVVSSDALPNAAHKANREWLKTHAGDNRGQWVAIRNGELLEAANSLEELIKQIGDTKGVLLTTAY